MAKITQPTAYGPLATRRYGSFAGKTIATVTPPVRAVFDAWTADSVTFSAWTANDATFSEDDI